MQLTHTFNLLSFSFCTFTHTLMCALFLFCFPLGFSSVSQATTLEHIHRAAAFLMLTSCLPSSQNNCPGKSNGSVTEKRNKSLHV